MRVLLQGVVILLFFAGAHSGTAESTLSTLTMHGDMQGRDYHAALYRGKPCVACHATSEPAALPADDVCLKCHQLEKLVTATARPESEVWQNPHNNLHWGKDVPCMECHGEHRESKPLCQGCHSFDYPNYKP